VNTNKTFLVFGIVLSVVCFLAIGKTFGESQDAVRKAIEAGSAEWAKLYNAGNAAGITALYTDDAKVLPPNSDFVSGKEGITAVWQGMMNSGAKGGSLQPVEVTGMGDHAVEVGTYEINDGAGKTLDKGKYIVVWKKVGSGWKLYRDIWNSSMPAAAAPK
jgi:uncharacterized protein (TIGR02246 family)